MHFVTYWKVSFARAFDSAWETVIGDSGARVLALTVIFILAIYFKDRRKEEPMRKGLKDGAWSVGITAAVFIVYTVGNALFFQPPKRHVEGVETHAQATNALASVTGDAANLRATNSSLKERVASLEQKPENVVTIRDAQREAAAYKDRASAAENDAEYYRGLWMGALTDTNFATSLDVLNDAIEIVKRSNTQQTNLSKILESERDLGALNEKRRLQQDKQRMAPIYKLWEYVVARFNPQLEAMAKECGETAGRVMLPAVDALLEKNYRKEMIVVNGAACQWQCSYLVQVRGVQALEISFLESNEVVARASFRTFLNNFQASLKLNAEPPIVKNYPFSDTTNSLLGAEQILGLLLESRKK